MPRTINIEELYKNSFGYVGRPFPTYFDTFHKVTVPKGEGLEVFKSINESDVYGTPYFMPFKFKDEFSSDGWYKLPNEPIVTLTLNKNTIETVLVGSKENGNVIEAISLGNYMIEISGILINETSNDIPQQDLQKLRYFCESLKSIKVSNMLLSLFNIENIFIKTAKLPPIEGNQHCMPYSISAVSDKPIELVIKSRPTTK